MAPRCASPFTWRPARSDAVALLRRLVPSYQPSPALAEAAGVAPEGLPAPGVA
jgi:hypothetical protein